MTNLYLDLLEKCLLNTIYQDAPNDPWSGGRYDPGLRADGKDWPSQAHTMIGAHRLHQLRQACEHVLSEQIPGDFIETGVWRGGACILMRGVLQAYQDRQRRVCCADSFHGLPPPDAARYPQDRNDAHHSFAPLSVSLEQVRANFARYDLLDEQVCFLPGWFQDTLPAAPVERLAILRLDGDMYASTMQALEALYDKVSPGGYVIVDDYGAIPTCRAAVHDFRSRKQIIEHMIPIDWGGVYWRKM
jgi:hypothetical protein